MACACIRPQLCVYDQVSACMHTCVYGMCVSESLMGWRRGTEEGESGIYPFIKGIPTPRPPPATGLQALLTQLEPKGHRGPPVPALRLSPLHLSVSVPAPGGPPWTPPFIQWGSLLTSQLPFRGQEGQAPGPLLQASEGQWAPWLGRRSPAGWTPGPHYLTHEGTVETWAERLGRMGHGV